MSITAGTYTFEGPYTDTSKLQNRSGIYAIHCCRDQKYFLIDVGESSDLKDRVENHDRKDCWKRNCSGTLTVSVLYTQNLQQPGRIAIEQAVRNQFRPSCGQR